MSARLEVRLDHPDLARLEAALRARIPELLDAAGALVESQTRRRITEDKTAPDGTPWQPWSDAYRATRHAGHSLLRGDTSGLLDSIQYTVAGDELAVGSDLDYAAHQFFGTEPGKHHNLPSRQALGLSAGDADELDDLIADVLADWAREGARPA